MLRPFFRTRQVLKRVIPSPFRSIHRGYATADTRKPRVWPFYFTVGALIGGGAYMFFNRKKDETSPNLLQRVTGFYSTLEDPAFEKLLPEPIVDPQNPRPYTLVVDLDKFLVCHIWDREQGRWRIAKRPGAELFLFYAAQLYEVVVFSSLPQHEGDVIVKKLDPYGCITYSLYRFATKYRKGVYYKDIGHLNREMSKVIVLGHDEAGFSPHPDNYIKMKPWNGDAKDTTLEETIDFLEMLAFSRLPDIRPVARQYQSKYFPEAFDHAQEEQYLHNLQIQKNSLQSRIAQFFSFGKSTKTFDSKEDGYMGRKMERMEMRRKEYARIKELMQKQLQAELQKEKEFYSEHKMSLLDLFSKGPPPKDQPSS